MRDRFRSEKIVSSTQMVRHIDYDIDIDLGTVRFRSPVLSRDASLNSVFIVAEYEVESGHADQLSAAGRVAAKLAGGAVQVGLGAIHDETAGSATVLGADLKVRPDRSTEVRVEIAAGGRGGLTAGTAWLVEAQRRTGPLDLLVYARSQAAGFGVGQQNVVEAGTRSIDVGLQGSVQRAWSAHATAFSGGPSVGLSPAGNLWITVGYNVAGYRDRDFEADRYTARGPYLTARIKFDRAAITKAGRLLLGRSG